MSIWLLRFGRPLIQYRIDVENGDFPGLEHTFVMSAEEAEKI